MFEVYRCGPQGPPGVGRLRQQIHKGVLAPSSNPQKENRRFSRRNRDLLRGTARNRRPTPEHERGHSLRARRKVRSPNRNAQKPQRHVSQSSKIPLQKTGNFPAGSPKKHRAQSQQPAETRIQTVNPDQCKPVGNQAGTPGSRISANQQVVRLALPPV